MAHNTIRKQYLCTCPLCLHEYTMQILQQDGCWHCKLCGILHYSPEYRKQIDQLLNNPKYRKIFIKYVQESRNKSNSSIDINPSIIEGVLKEKGILK